MDHVTPLKREPKDTVPIKFSGMRITGRRIEHREDTELPGLLIEPPKGDVAIAHVPDGAACIDIETMRQQAADTPSSRP
ncbi:MAG: hypothetical protein AAF608_13780 [Pseudomonadota bacterium]